MAKILIQELPFEEILRACYETLNVESSGNLYGHTEHNRGNLIWVVEAAHPEQLAKRTPRGFEPLPGCERSGWTLFTDYIGGFHLHPRARVQKKGNRKINNGLIYMSKQDKKIFNENHHIELVVTLNPVLKTERLKNENPYLVSGYIYANGVFRFNVGGYYYNSGVRRAEIVVPEKILCKLT